MKRDPYDCRWVYEWFWKGVVWFFIEVDLIKDQHTRISNKLIKVMNLVTAELSILLLHIDNINIEVVSNYSAAWKTIPDNARKESERTRILPKPEHRQKATSQTSADSIGFLLPMALWQGNGCSPERLSECYRNIFRKSVSRFFHKFRVPNVYEISN